MSLEAIKMVSEAEQYAQDIRTETQAQIRKIKSDGEREGRERLETALSYALKENERLMEEAEQKAGLRANQIMEQSRLECKALKKQVSGKLDEAAAFILERIVVT